MSENISGSRSIERRKKENPKLPTGRPKYFIGGILFSVFTTIVCFLLAILPAFNEADVEYNPELAVLTATLITIVWYTLFTYWAATRHEPSYIRVRLYCLNKALNPKIENLSRRHLNANITMRVWINDIERKINNFYRGMEILHLLPDSEFQGNVIFKDWEELQGITNGDGNIEKGNNILVMLRVTWTDDMKELGDTGARYYRIPLDNIKVISVIAEDNIIKYFPDEKVINPAPKS